MVVRTKIGETDETKHRPVVKKSRMGTHRRGMKVVILDWEKIKLARERERESDEIYYCSDAIILQFASDELKRECAIGLNNEFNWERIKKLKHFKSLIYRTTLVLFNFHSFIHPFYLFLFFNPTRYWRHCDDAADHIFSFTFT